VTELRTGTPFPPRPKATGDTRLESTSAAPQAPPHEQPVYAPRRPVELIARAKEQLRILTGVDSVSGFTKSDGGWHLSVTMVELHRVPPVTDMLAGYEVELDAAGNIVSYRRGRRYFRDQVGDET
jgi:hypothetical protein